MRKLILFIIVATLAFFVFASPLFGFTVKGDDTLNITETENDDVYAMGNTINFSGEVNGDLVAAGGQLTINGTVTEDLIAAGGMIDMGGDVKDDIRMAGGTITIKGSVGDDVIIAGGQIVIEKDAKIGGDLVISGGRVIINGEIAGKIIASAGEITIAGKVGNGVEIGGVSSLIIGSTAEINGDLVYSSDSEAKIADGATISGSIKFNEIPKPDKKSFAMPLGVFGTILGATYVGSRVVSFLSMFIIGIILLLAMPVIFQKFNNRMRTSFGFCVAGGAITLFGVPVAIAILGFIGILLLITVVGAGLGILAFTANCLMATIYFVLIYTSTAFLSFLLGEVILSKSKLNLQKYGWKVLAYLIGLAIIMIAYSIPFVGGVAKFAGVLFGLGGLAMVLKDYIWNEASKSVKK